MNTVDVLVIDPGEDTGILGFNFSSKKVVYCMTIPIRDASGIVFAVSPKHLIVERKPKFDDWPDDLATEYKSIINTTHSIKGCILHLITPGIWKPIAKARKWKDNFCYTQHEQDVCNIFRYWYMITYGTMIENLIVLEKS